MTHDRVENFPLQFRNAEFLFSDPDLHKAYVMQFYTTGAIQEGDDNNNDRPRKKARLSLPDEAPPDFEIQSYLLGKLCSLLSVQKATDLSNLSRIAV